MRWRLGEGRHAEEQVVKAAHRGQVRWRVGEDDAPAVCGGGGALEGATLKWVGGDGVEAAAVEAGIEKVGLGKPKRASHLALYKAECASHLWAKQAQRPAGS